MSVELALYLAAAAAGLAPLLLRTERSRRLVLRTGAVLLAGTAVGAALWRPTLPSPSPDLRPLQVREGTVEEHRGFASSDACRSCHPSQYHSWHRSFHRTMTQVITPDTMTADFDVSIAEAAPQLPGVGAYHTERLGDTYWVEMPDPRAPPAETGSAEPPRIRRQLVMSTGLHHYQLYWYPTGDGRELHMFPFLFLNEEKRWVPRGAVFLKPPGLPEPLTEWNFDCLPCHSTDGQPRFVSRDGEWVYDSQMAEAGISCEACHGPGREHVRENRSPLRRYLYRSERDPTIVQPEHLDAAAASQVCGQCHSVNFPPTREEAARWLREGPLFRAGGNLSESRYVMRRPSAEAPWPPFLEAQLAENPTAMEQWFWRDGEVRVTGREYNNLIESPCFQGGDYSCLSCHSLHESEPDDQLREGMRGDRACLQCHGSYSSSRAIERHTHHAPESSGSLCYNCHMPNTTYGLLKATRSHTVTSPSVAGTVATGRLNACNGCHLDETLGWTERYLGDWYDQPPATLTDEHRTIAASALWLLQGDAGQRALTAWAMGWPDAQQASGRDWIGPLLGRTLEDPYDVVRYISARSLRTLPGFEDFEYDFLALPEDRSRAVQRALDLWDRRPPGRTERPRGPVLLTASGELRRDLVEALLSTRDDHPMVLAE